MKKKLTCPHCHNNNLVGISVREVLENFGDIMTSPSQLVSTQYRYIRSRAKMFSGIFKDIHHYQIGPMVCESCKGYALECAKCKHVFRLLKYKPAEIIMCPECDAHLVLEWF